MEPIPIILYSWVGRNPVRFGYLDWPVWAIKNWSPYAQCGTLLGLWPPIEATAFGWLQKRAGSGDNPCVAQAARHRAAPAGKTPFQRGVVVVVTLGNPREKFWGAIQVLSPEGLSLRGIELASFEDTISMMKEGEPFSPTVVFFPMHRVERVELDQRDGNVPSLAERFAAKTGMQAAVMLMRENALRQEQE